MKGLTVWARRGLQQEHVPDEWIVTDTWRNPSAAVNTHRVAVNPTLCSHTGSHAKFKGLDPERAPDLPCTGKSSYNNLSFFLLLMLGNSFHPKDLQCSHQEWMIQNTDQLKPSKEG